MAVAVCRLPRGICARPERRHARAHRIVREGGAHQTVRHKLAQRIELARSKQGGHDNKGHHDRLICVAAHTYEATTRQAFVCHLTCACNARV
eukprot:7283265-Prymnesium_polylepis.2